MSHHYLDVRDLRYAYPDGTEALKGASFRLEHGEAVGLVGANGAGKSTMMLALTGLIVPSGGTIDVGGTLLSKKTVGEVRRRIGFVFQDSEDQLFMPTVFDDVAFGPLNQGLSESEVRERVTDALERVGAERLADRPTYRLSGGEKRAVAIATVLAMLPDILIMDEPTSSLDPKSRRRVMELLKGFEHTKIITSHDLDMVLETCQRVIMISNGAVAADGNAADILSDPELLDRCGLEIPLSLQNCPQCGCSKGHRGNC